MKNTNVELTAEELALVIKLREEKAKQEAAELASSSLEVKFKKVIEIAKEEIAVHIKDSRAALAKAVVVSEKYGIPFYSSMVDMDRGRRYVPKTFSQKWPTIDYEILSEYDIYSTEDVGWEYWSTSSLSC